MIKAVLLDLDSALTHSPAGDYHEAYRRALAKHLQQRLNRESLPCVIARAIRSLNEERDMMTANAGIIAGCIAEELGTSAANVHHALCAFAETEHQALRRFTTTVPGVRQLIEALFAQEIPLAIAAKPMYPESVMQQRMAWAGLSRYYDDFAFVAHSENMRFAKPHPAYYAELVARVGVEPDEALLISSCLADDIEPATMIGLHTWRVSESNPFDSIIEQVQSDEWQNRYMPRPLDHRMLAAQFRGNLAALYGLVSEVKEHQWHQQPDPKEWSIVQILCHLAETESAVHQKRIETILSADNPFIRALPPPGPDIPPCHDDGLTVMEIFRSKRLATLELLSELSPDDWRRPARHSIFGMTNLLEMAYFTAQHDRLHIAQLCQTLGKCSDDM